MYISGGSEAHLGGIDGLMRLMLLMALLRFASLDALRFGAFAALPLWPL
jgi:hypothetical protein